MRSFLAIFAGCFLLIQPSSASAPTQASKLFLLEDANNNQWCSYLAESTWKARVQQVGAMTVGTVAFSNGHLSQIDMTETDESGDWTVYDHYFFDDHGQLVRLSRLLNVLPGDRSVSESFSISKGKATKTATSEKHLSTGKPTTSPTADWLPDVSIVTAANMFPFSALLSLPGLRTSPTSCVKVPAAQ